MEDVKQKKVIFAEPEYRIINSVYKLHIGAEFIRGGLFSVLTAFTHALKMVFRSAGDEVKDKIAAILENVKIEKALKEWIEELKDKAYISVRE